MFTCREENKFEYEEEVEVRWEEDDVVEEEWNKTKEESVSKREREIRMGEKARTKQRGVKEVKEREGVNMYPFS